MTYSNQSHQEGAERKRRKIEMRKQLLLILLLMLAPFGTRAQEDSNLDSVYMSYMSDSSKAQIMKLRNEMERIEQQREERQIWWYWILTGCALSAVIVTGGIFYEVFRGNADAPIHRKIYAAVICLCGGIVIFLLDVGWLYMSFEAGQKLQKLILFAILLVLGIALWIYTKHLKKENTEEQ